VLFLQPLEKPSGFFIFYINIIFLKPIFIKMKKIYVFLTFFLFTLCCANAKNLNFQIVQNNPGQEDVFAMSYLFEQALVDFFFESGHIVSNSPVFIKKDDSADKAELKRALVETIIGSMDILVRLEVVFIQEKANSSEVFVLDSIKTVKWNNYNAKTGKLISTGSENPGPVDATNNNETGVYNFASYVASQISSTLKNAK